MKNEVDNFEFTLKKKIIKPTFSTSLDSLSFYTKDLKIKSINQNNNFFIYINKQKILVGKLKTINDMWSGKDSVKYANQITRINYYQDLNKILLQLDFDMCVGIGCSVNYQLIHDLKTKKTYPFGRFRTGIDMDLYKIENREYYLSKTYHGGNVELKDTIFYEMFELNDILKPYPKGKKIARFTGEGSDYKVDTDFTEIKF
ncbi:hypothetical protein [Chryseobacterium sp.]|uniref:hypothetical protein n=1 Tax=Chryseobacterium sp. TaxID=1871047 RepID=UPI00289D70BF|nr:hypothetical protein [Chryseobacterium sp.]